MKNFTIASLLLCAATASTAQTDSTHQPTNYNLEPVEITANSSANKSILYQPQSISKLGTVELKRNTGLFFDDAINTNIPGVFMEKRSVSGGQQFNIRGYGSGVGPRGANNNFDGQGYKVYLNGIPVTDAEGITVMDDIDFGSIGNVEVIKGPAGTLYGQAIAGVVNLSTIQPEEGKITFGQDVMIGSYGLQRYTTHVSVGGKKSALLLNYGHQTVDGYMNHTASRKDFINIMGNFRPNEKQAISTYFGYSNSYDGRGGELTIDQYNKKDYSGNPAYIKNNAHSNLISFRAGLGHTYTFNKHFANTTSVFVSGVTNNSSSAAGWTDKAPINYGVRSTLNMDFKLNENFKLTSVTGVEAQQQYAQVIGYNMVADSTDLSGYNKIGAMKSNQWYYTANTSLFTEWTLSMPYDISVTGGIGLNFVNIKLNDRFYVATSKNPSSYSTSYTNMLSPHVAINKVFNKQVSVYLSYSTGYKAPVSSNIFIPTTGALNTALKPEMGSQFEVGTKGSLLANRLSYQAAFFMAKFTDKMTSVAAPLNGTTTAYTYVANGGNQNHTGIELAANIIAYRSAHGFVKSIVPFANFCYSDFKYDGYSFQSLDAKKNPVVANYDGKAVAGIAPVTANAGLDFSTRIGLYANATYSYRDVMPISSDGVNKTSSYSLINAKIGIQRTIKDHLSFDLFGGINNITGTQYYYMVFINQLPDAYLPAPDKANFFGGINIKYSL
jgi:iron complex outermembrane receptor protein